MFQDCDTLLKLLIYLHLCGSVSVIDVFLYEFSLNRYFLLCQVRLVSDQFPIEVMLKSSAHFLQSTLMLISISVIVCSFLPTL